MDGAKEFCHGRLEAHLSSHVLSTGHCEHLVWMLKDGFQTLLADSGLPMSFWGDAVLTMAYICNRVPTSALPLNVTPFEEMEHTKPDLSHLQVWGCKCFVAIPPELCTKGGPHHFEVIFVGYEENRLGWCVWDLNRKYHFSYDIIFNQLVPGCLSPSPSTSSTSSSTSSPSPCPTHVITQTTKGQAFADTIKDCDDCLAKRLMMNPHPQQSLSAITDFVSFFATDDLLPSETFVDLNSFEDEAFMSFCFLTAVNHHHFQYFSPLHLFLLESYWIC